MHNIEVVIPRKVTADEVLQVIQSVTTCEVRVTGDAIQTFPCIKRWVARGKEVAFFLALYEESADVADPINDEYLSPILRHFNTLDLFSVIMETSTISGDPIFKQVVLALRDAFGGMVDSGAHLLYAISEGEAVDEEKYLRIFL